MVREQQGSETTLRSLHDRPEPTFTFTLKKGDDSNATLAVTAAGLIGEGFRREK
jgi:hypothetical protein